MRLDVSHRDPVNFQGENHGGTILLEKKDNILRIKMMKAVQKSWGLSLFLPQNSSVMPGTMLKIFHR